MKLENMKRENVFVKATQKLQADRGPWVNCHAVVPKIKGFPSVQNKYEYFYILFR